MLKSKNTYTPDRESEIVESFPVHRTFLLITEQNPKANCVRNEEFEEKKSKLHRITDHRTYKEENNRYTTTLH